MRIVAVGMQPVGLIAIGLNATGIIAIGELATGVVAIGQLARGCIVGGQLALGLVSFGQLSVGVCWSGGLVGIGATTSGPGFVPGLFGRFPRRRLIGRPGDPLQFSDSGAFNGRNFEAEPVRAAGLVKVIGRGRPMNAPARGPRRVAVGMFLTAVIAAGWWFGAGPTLADALTRPEGILIQAPLER